MVITLNSNDVSKAPRTNEFRLADQRLQYLPTVTQVWTWDGGDAIVVMGGRAWDGTVPCYVVVRLGDNIRIVEAQSVNKALNFLGISDVQVA